MVNVRNVRNRLKSDFYGLSRRRLLFGVAFLRMNRREKELEHRLAVPGLMTFLGLMAAYYPITARLRFFERVQTAGQVFAELVVKDDFDARVRFSTATMHYLSAQGVIEPEKEIVQRRSDVTMVRFSSFGFHIIL